MPEDDIKNIADQWVFIKRIIDKKTEELKNLKKVLKDKMELQNVNKIRGDSYEIRCRVYRSKYSPFLDEEFFDLDAEIISDLVQSELVNKRTSYRLNTKKYQRISDNNQETLIDRFVIERKESTSLSIYSLL